MQTYIILLYVRVLFHFQRLGMGVGFIYYYFESNLERRNPLMNKIFLQEYIASLLLLTVRAYKDSISCGSPFLLASP